MRQSGGVLRRALPPGSVRGRAWVLLALLRALALPAMVEHKTVVIARAPPRPVNARDLTAEGRRARGEVERPAGNGSQLAGRYAMGVDREDMSRRRQRESMLEHAARGMATQVEVRVLGQVDARPVCRARCPIQRASEPRAAIDACEARAADERRRCASARGAATQLAWRGRVGALSRRIRRSDD